MESRFLDVDGFRTHYLEIGKGPVVVLLHGASVAIDAPATWASLMSALAGSFRVIAFDQIGFGESAMPADGRMGNRLERVPHAIRFLDRLGVKRAALVGHSEGAFMAARIALERPQLATAVIAVTSGGLSPRLGGSDDDSWIEASKQAYTYGASADTEDGFIEQSRILNYAPHAGLEKILRANYRRPQTAGQLALFRRFVRGPNYPDDYLALQKEHIYPHAEKLPRTLLIWGDSDRTVPVARGLALQRVLKKADFHVFARAAHMVMYDRERDFNVLVHDWLASASQEAG
jgi:pimeloyl-ACP methyl ester carboxylesterase